MQGNRLARPFWGDWFPVRERLLNESRNNESGVNRDGVLMVDVAGGLGHDLVNFKQHFPEVVRTGEVAQLVLQDQPHVIKKIEKEEGLGAGIRCETYDFFKPQPVHGT